MWIERLYLKGVRNLAAVDLRPQPGVNLITGMNGAGKTALLEGIQVALSGRSFREREMGKVMGSQEAALETAAWICRDRQDGGRHAVVRRARAESRTSFTIDGFTARGFAGFGLPSVIALTQEEMRAVRYSAERRRALLDVFLFHVEPEYAQAWRRYRVAMRQRNAALRGNGLCSPWEEAMSAAATLLHEVRSIHVARVAEIIPSVLEAFGPDTHLDVLYRPGWDVAESLGECLRANRARDQIVGHTLAGPHRADLSFRFNPARRSVQPSAGQFKIAYMAFRLGQAASLGEGKVVFLADDLGAELDEGNAKSAFSALQRLSHQLFVTVPAARFDVTAGPLPTAVAARFHVERGSVTCH